jgi:hypothetical protein
MKEKGIALCPTMTADEAISEYRGWNKEAPRTCTIEGETRKF